VLAATSAALALRRVSFAATFFFLQCPSLLKIGELWKLLLPSQLVGFF
jgi:hypothetical protein